ncbi:somatostatin-1B-like [Pristis pectinata]|uniref:somatostatin-1B-like n=1 Tax=Pristis pectinata TaxID=685728 RepID=UPI00223CFED0|nr:somatostatin-1B-like [Pristis pectinata]
MKWLMTVSVVSLLLLVGVEGADPLEERMRLQELTKSRKSLILKLLAGLLEIDDHLAEKGFTYSDTEEAESSREERSVDAGIPRREQKAPCKLFFWKTFSHC